MLHLFLDDKPWFEAKRFGYGTGLPIAWQGWVLLAAFIASVIGIAIEHERRGGQSDDPLFWSLLAILTVIFVVITKAKTRGGWRWHWGWRIDDSDD